MTSRCATARGIQLANAKIDEIRNGFTEWLEEQSPEFKKRLTDMYNNKFNCFVRPEVRRLAPKVPGLGPERLGIQDLYPSQKDCIWMLKQNGGGIADHEVGTGKTLIMCVSAHEMKRLGLVHKPMIIGLKANVREIAETYRRAYPNARILYASEKTLQPPAGCASSTTSRTTTGIASSCRMTSSERYRSRRSCSSASCRRSWTRWEGKPRSAASAGQGRVKGDAQGGWRKGKSTFRRSSKKVEHAIKSRTDDVVDFKQMGHRPPLCR